VLDLRLPDLSAEEVVAGLRRLGTFGLLVVSALPDVHRRAATLGAAAVFRKPYDLGELLEQAEQLTAIRGASD
jgi:DNA-binding response OmpR family regulator